MRALSVIILLFVGCANAQPITLPTPVVATLMAENVSIILSRQPCAIPAVANLPYRALWITKATGAAHDGCYDLRQGTATVLFYFDDRTILLLPTHIFDFKLLRYVPAGGLTDV
jgi:hypothetical protein